MNNQDKEKVIPGLQEQGIIETAQDKKHSNTGVTLD
jgi:hypothetical protein